MGILLEGGGGVSLNVTMGSGMGTLRWTLGGAILVTTLSPFFFLCNSMVSCFFFCFIFVMRRTITSI